MKKITILILTILAFNVGAFSANNLFAEITIYGKVTSSTNQPLERADVWLWGDGTQCDEDGSYKITLPDTFNVLIVGFTAVNHSGATFNIVALPNTSYEINAILNPHYFKDLPDTLFVIGNFNNFSYENEIIPMNENEKGIYSATIRSENDTLAYQILIRNKIFIKDINEYYDDSRSINGQNALFYQPARPLARNFYDYDYYISYLVNETKNHNEIKNYNIVFDMNKFRTEYSEPEFTSNNPVINELLQFGKMGEKLFIESRNSIDNRVGINREIQRTCAEKIDSLFQKVQYKETKMGLIMWYFQTLNYGGAIPNDVSFAANSSILNFMFDSIDINFGFWDSRQSFNHNYYFWACLIAGESPLTNNSPRFENYIQANKGTDRNAWGSYMIVIDYALRKKDTVAAKRYFARMKEEFPEHSPEYGAVKSIINNYDLDDSKKIRAGNMIPDFELANLDNKDATISMQALRGKYILIDVWGTWCLPCIMDLPHLEAVYEVFKDKNFIIYSIARDDAEKVVKFRNGKHKMPWLHSVIDYDNAVRELLEITAYPTQILISPTGEILLVNIGTIGEYLEEILGKYLK